MVKRKILCRFIWIGFFVTTVSLFSCRNVISEGKKDCNFQIVDKTSEIRMLQKDVKQKLFEEISGFENTELSKSLLFSELSDNRSLSVSNYLSEEEEEEITSHMSIEEIERLEIIMNEYVDAVEKFAAVPVFDPLNLPPSVYETNIEVIIGDNCYLKTIPEDLEKVIEIARNYYGENENTRGAVLHLLVGTMTFDGWPEGIVYYGFDDFPKEEKKIVQDCMNEWESKCDKIITFKNKGDFNWWTRTKWVLGSYRVLRIQNKTLGGNTLGLTTPGRIWAPYMNFDISMINEQYNVTKIKSFTYRHEIGHALGLQHEFDRFDRDKYIVLYDSSSKWSDFSVNVVGRFFITSYGTYDYSSVMNYPDIYCKKMNDGSKGELIRLSNIENISEGDINVIKELYKY